MKLTVACLRRSVKLKILICDDISSYSVFLKKTVSDILEELSIDADFHIINELSEVKPYMDANKVDIIFFDIMFKNISSIDWWVKNIGSSKYNVIFMTSFPEEAYNISKVDNALFMVKTRTDREYIEELLLKIISNISNKAPNLISIKIGNSKKIVNAHDIIYIESQRNNILIHTQKGIIRARSTIGGFFRELPPNFMRVHKSYVINMNYVVQTETHKFVLENGQVVYVNPRRYREFEEKYKQFINI